VIPEAGAWLDVRRLASAEARMGLSFMVVRRAFILRLLGYPTINTISMGDNELVSSAAVTPRRDLPTISNIFIEKVGEKKAVGV
jgi:hypothetical protein